MGGGGAGILVAFDKFIRHKTMKITRISAPIKIKKRVSALQLLGGTQSRVVD